MASALKNCFKKPLHLIFSGPLTIVSKFFPHGYFYKPKNISVPIIMTESFRYFCKPQNVDLGIWKKSQKSP